MKSSVNRQQIIGALNMAAAVRRGLPVYFPGTNARKVYRDWLIHARNLRLRNDTTTI